MPLFYWRHRKTRQRVGVWRSCLRLLIKGIRVSIFSRANTITREHIKLYCAQIKAERSPSHTDTIKKVQLYCYGGVIITGDSIVPPSVQWYKWWHYAVICNIYLLNCYPGEVCQSVGDPVWPAATRLHLFCFIHCLHLLDLTEIGGKVHCVSSECWERVRGLLVQFPCPELQIQARLLGHKHH